MTELLHLSQHPGTNAIPFEAVIVDVVESGIVLDQTGFYPQGGGQPADMGQIQLNGALYEIVNVKGRELVIHHTEVDDFEIGQQVKGIIDNTRRNQLAKMHTAQHLISAIANELWGAQTVGNQIGTERTRIDLLFDNRDQFDAEQLCEYVNDNISANLAVKMDFMPPGDLKTDERVRINLDRLPPDIDLWRTIQIGEIDLCPCAGTHVASTGEIPSIQHSKVKSKGAGKLRFEYTLNN